MLFDPHTSKKVAIAILEVWSLLNPAPASQDPSEQQKYGAALSSQQKLGEYGS